ncbi:PrsW family intramembrane metalloprotease [Microbacterium luteolum]|uniref:PrsW family intramembrane metalloprotease n=1 Tax=Microbacterium luteolum TaxID=69367 RepID=A0ABY7XRZ6_MICLT|nr:PrsW family intramembrane metalloprotease [Microbacterium luteolum]WDM44955.1 PrsW family intramembrane metalloprotease [Microbacterium luteolum]
MTTPHSSRRIPWNRVWPPAALFALILTNTWSLSQIGPVGFVVGLGPAVVLAVVTGGTFLWLDRWERERPSLLLSAFVWGASFAGLGAIVFQAGFEKLAIALAGPAFQEWASALIVTPITEEVLKGLFLIWLFRFHRQRIRGLLNGIVFGGLAGAGFAFSENIFYFGRAFVKFTAAPTDPAMMVEFIGTFVLRGFMAPFLHPFWVALFGLTIALSTRRPPGASRVLVASSGLVASLILHGVYDWAAIVGRTSDGFAVFKFFGVVILPLMIAMAVLAIVLRRREGRAIVRRLPLLAAEGRIAYEEASSLDSLHRRRRWRADHRRARGRTAAKLLGRYQAEVSALALMQERNDDASDVEAQRRELEIARQRMLIAAERGV